MTDKLNLNLKNCYGIGKLEAELEFKHKGFAIYAPNGVMKTSLAKTMMDMSKGDEPKDLAFPERESVFEVNLNDQPIKQDEIFVVKSYDENYSSGEVSTLLANDDLKKKYEEVHKEIGEAKKALDKKLRIFSGYGERSRENIDSIIEAVFEGEYFEALLRIQNELDETEEAAFSNANYKLLFDPKVLQLLEKDDVSAVVEEFAQKYDELTESSPVLRKNFQYHHINQVHHQLKENNFFNAGHSINLSDEDGDQKSEFTTSNALLEKIESEKQRVLTDEALMGKFNDFNSKLKNKELQAFRDYITENQYLLPELQDMDAFRRKLWVQYLLNAKEEFDQVVGSFKHGQSELEIIVSEARTDPNDWDEVIKEFNRRFIHLPFQLSVAK